MCPNGVEWKTLGEVCNFVNGFAFKSSLFRQSGSRIIRITNIDGVNINTVDSIYFDSNDYKEDLSKYIIKQGDIAIAMSGATTGKIGRYIDNDNSYINQRVGLFKPKQNLFNSYLYHFLLSKTNDINILAGGGAQPNLSSNSLMAKVKIPLPPLAIQTRIVEILDHFTNLTANLTADLNLRRKQFEHYREKLLSLDGVEMVKLFDVAKNSTGLTYKPSDVSDSGTLVLRSSNIQNSMLCFDDNVFVKMKSIPTRALVKENDILVCVRNGSSSLIGKAAIIDKSCEGMAFGAFMTILRAFNINYKYLFYVWQSDRIQKMVHGDSGAPINQITNAVLDKIMIPYPSEDTQHSIVSILDKFTALIENIEKELALRQKQYEYYREQLLSFPQPARNS